MDISPTLTKEENCPLVLGHFFDACFSRINSRRENPEDRNRHREVKIVPARRNKKKPPGRQRHRVEGA
jgi:hypothetical protein